MASPIMAYFDHRHLKDGPLRDISKEYTEFAEKLESFLPAGAEKSTALRKLLESKDSAVRSALDITTEDQRAPRTEDPTGEPIVSVGDRQWDLLQVVTWVDDLQNKGRTREQALDEIFQRKARTEDPSSIRPGGGVEITEDLSSNQINIRLDEQVFGPNGDAALRAVAERAQRRMRNSY